MAFVLDPITGQLIDEKELQNKKKQQQNLQDIGKSYGIDTEDVVPEAEENNEVGRRSNEGGRACRCQVWPTSADIFHDRS